MTDSRPIFIFFKMHNCGHCVSFFSRPSPEKSTWAQLLRDQELASKVRFQLVEHGIKKNQDDGSVTRNVLPDEYKFVNYGPYFYLQKSGDASQGFEMKGVKRTFHDMKAWILKTIQNPKIKGKTISQKERKPRAPRANRMGSGKQPLPPHVLKRIEQRRAMLAMKSDDFVQGGDPSVKQPVVEQKPAPVQSKFSTKKPYQRMVIQGGRDSVVSTKKFITRNPRKY